MELMPTFWNFMLASLFRVKSQRLRQQLWQAYPKSTALCWHLARCAEPAPTEMVSYERIKQLAQHLDPAALVHAAEALAPEGKPRPKDIRQFEETVLRLLDAHGKLKWLPENPPRGKERI